MRQANLFKDTYLGSYSRSRATRGVVLKCHMVAPRSGPSPRCDVSWSPVEGARSQTYPQAGWSHRQLHGTSSNKLLVRLTQCSVSSMLLCITIIDVLAFDIDIVIFLCRPTDFLFFNYRGNIPKWVYRIIIMLSVTRTWYGNSLN